MKIDAFPHILPKPYYERMLRATGPAAAAMQKRTSGIPVLWDLEARFRVMERFGPEYVQILTLPRRRSKRSASPPSPGTWLASRTRRWPSSSGPTPTGSAASAPRCR